MLHITLMFVAKIFEDQYQKVQIKSSPTQIVTIEVQYQQQTQLLSNKIQLYK